MKNPSELIQEMYDTKQHTLPNALKEKTVPGTNEISFHTLVEMMTDDPYINHEKHDHKI